MTLVFGATYGPSIYRELPGALRSALAGNRAPLLRLVAEDAFPSGGVDDAVDYSEGLDAAVSCHDYPQLYDMTSPSAARKTQYAAAVSAEQQHRPAVYGPFTINEYLRSDWEEQDWCLHVARRLRRAPRRTSRPSVRSLPDDTDPRAQWRARLDHDSGRGRRSSPPTSRPPVRSSSSNSFHVTALATPTDARYECSGPSSPGRERGHRKHLGLRDAGPPGTRGREVRHLDREHVAGHRRLRQPGRLRVACGRERRRRTLWPTSSTAGTATTAATAAVCTAGRWDYSGDRHHDLRAEGASDSPRTSQ